MKKHAKLAFIIVLVGMVAAGIWRAIEPKLSDIAQVDTSDASGKKGTIIIGVDSWVGYFPLCSPQLKKRLRRVDYGLKCVDDAADYQDRFKKLKKSQYQFAVATVDSYILNGEDYDYPGPIVSVIDESKGGDAIVAWKDKYATLDDLKKDDEFALAYTPDSPSHHLIKSVASHFDIKNLRDGGRHIKTEGSAAALDALFDKQADVAVIWEPEVSKALSKKGIVRLLGTEDTKQLIVDILIASQRVVKNEPDLIKVLLKEYFRTLKYYREHQDELVADIADHYGIRKKQSMALLKGVEWVTLSQNAESWYGASSTGYSEEALITTIESAVDVLLENEDFDSNPVPDEDPYRLTNSRFISELYNDIGTTGFTSSGKSTSSQLLFKPLNTEQWNSLETIGSLKTRHIVFSSGTSEITYEGKQEIDEQVADLKHYPNFRVEVRGHTGLRGNKDANIALSMERADAVLRYMRITHGLEENRVRAVGFGSGKPLKKLPGESNRRYSSRLSRVEITLVREAY